MGKHLALAVAAQLARSQLLGDAPSNEEIVNVVARALARVAPLYVRESDSGTPRQLREEELEGAQLRHGATRLVLIDGRIFSSVSIKRADLRHAVAVLLAVGIPELGSTVRRSIEARQTEPRDRLAELRAHLAEIERLLRPPLIPEQTERATKLAVSLARSAPHGRISNFAMHLVSALHDARAGADGELPISLARLRAAVEEAGSA